MTEYERNKCIEIMSAMSEEQKCVAIQAFDTHLLFVEIANRYNNMAKVVKKIGNIYLENVDTNIFVDCIDNSYKEFEKMNDTYTAICEAFKEDEDED